MAADPVEILHQADVEAVVTALLEDWPGVTGPTGPAAAPVVSTTAALDAIGNAINTTGKLVGKEVFNTTTGLPVWAVGTTAGALWVDATGGTAHTPV